MSITLTELKIILKEIKDLHFMEGRAIKYVNVDWDNRTNTFWKIEFRHWFKRERTIFTNTNRPMEERVNLYGEVILWLMEGHQ